MFGWGVSGTKFSLRAVTKESDRSGRFANLSLILLASKAGLTLPDQDRHYKAVRAEKTYLRFLPLFFLW